MLSGEENCCPLIFWLLSEEKFLNSEFVVLFILRVYIESFFVGVTKLVSP
jgi:hypothetical protein